MIQKRAAFVALLVALMSSPGAAVTTATSVARSPLAVSTGESQSVTFGDRLISVPSGRHFYGSRFAAMTPDGAHVLVHSSSDLTAPPDVYGNGPGLFDIHGTTITRVECGDCYYVDAVTQGLSAVLAMTFSRVVPGDTDANRDLYLFDGAGPHLITPGNADGHAAFIGMAEDASKVLFSVKVSLAPEDTDTTEDFYLWTRATGATVLVSRGVLPPIFLAMSKDGSRVFFGGDVPGFDLGPSGEGAIFEWTAAGIALRGRGSFETIQDNGARVYMNSKLQLDPADLDQEFDAYLNDASGYHALSEPSSGYVWLGEVKQDGSAWTLGTDEKLTPEDTDSTFDLYLVTATSRTLITRGFQGASGWMDAAFTSAIYSTRSKLDPTDTDDWDDVYRWTAAAPDSPELLSGVGTPEVRLLAYATDGSKAFMTSRDQLVPEDTDSSEDVYEFANGRLSLVYPGTSDYRVEGWTPDLGRVVATAGNLSPEDLNGNVQDVYLADAISPTTPTVAVAQSPSPAYLGDEVTFDVTVEPTPGGGTVELLLLDVLGNTVGTLGSKPVDVAEFKARFAEGDPSWLKAVYSGTASVPRSESRLFRRSEIQPPNTVMFGWPNEPSVDTTARFKFEYEASTYYQPAVSLQCQLDGGAWASCTSPHDTAALTDGLHTFGVRGIDASGRVELHPEAFAWHVDTSAPMIDAGPAPGSWVGNNRPAFEFSSEVDQFACRWDAGAYTACNSPNQPPSTLSQGAHSFAVRTTDDAGNVGAPATRSFSVDTQSPSSVIPSIGIFGGRFTDKIPVRLTWPTASDNLSGVAAYALARKIGNGALSVLNGSTPLTLSFNDMLTRATTYGYLMRVVDRASNATPWSAPWYVVSDVRENGGADATRTGRWSTKPVPASSGGSVLRSTKGRSTISVTFTGRSFAWVSTMAPSAGQARIYVDGAPQPTAVVDLYASSRITRQIVWTRNFAAGGRHTIRIVVMGTAGRPAVDVDAFLVLRTP